MNEGVSETASVEICNRGIGSCSSAALLLPTIQVRIHVAFAFHTARASATTKDRVESFGTATAAVPIDGRNDDRWQRRDRVDSGGEHFAVRSSLGCPQQTNLESMPPSLPSYCLLLPPPSPLSRRVSES